MICHVVWIDQSECRISFFLPIYGIQGPSEPEPPLSHYYWYVLINNQEWETSQTIDKKIVKTTALKKQTKIQAKKPKNYEA